MKQKKNPKKQKTTTKQKNLEQNETKGLCEMQYYFKFQEIFKASKCL